MINKLLFLILIIISSGCIKEDLPTDPNTADLETNSLLLREIEARGDFINSSTTALFPSFISAKDLHSKLNQTVIVDIRNNEDFNSGHIPNSVNITSQGLFEYVISQNGPGKQIVLVSYSGQAASYYTYLFRVYGLQNVYSLLFGIASWNAYFRNEILQYTSDVGLGGEIKINVQSKHYYLPVIEKSSSKSIKDFLDERIKKLIQEGFVEKPDSPSRLIPFSSNVTTNFAELEENLSEYFVACYGTNNLYTSTKDGITHLPGTVLYYPFAPISDIQSTLNLQTFPTNKTIAVYSYSGQLSAMLTAHLRLLGYEAKSVLFGAQNGNYSYLSSLIGTALNYVYPGVKDNYNYE